MFDFWDSTQLAGKHIILITVISSLIFWVVSGFLKGVYNRTKEKKLFSKIRKYLKGRPLNFKQIVKFEDHYFGRGSDIKWYEKHQYKKYRKSIKARIMRRESQQGKDTYPS